MESLPRPLSVVLPAWVHDRLEFVRARAGALSIDEVVSRAVRLLDVAITANLEGSKVFIVHKTGAREEVTP